MSDLPKCCNEPTCRRSQPMMLQRTDLDGVWYVVTRWRHSHDDKNGRPVFEAVERHQLPADQQNQLNRMRNGDANG